jgi:hypothetical protein
MTKLFTEPSEVHVIDGEVIVDGPDGAHYSTTPQAAAKTSARLLEAAVRAQGHRREEGGDGTH